ncbi:unnamed protein product [Amoebophrya sp. A25]|nr:unnamed protein product [Amoebophrya sp. A25]|eukprot:GSA25T00026194001.1
MTMPRINMSCSVKNSKMLHLRSSCTLFSFSSHLLVLFSNSRTAYAANPEQQDLGATLRENREPFLAKLDQKLLLGAEEDVHATGEKQPLHENKNESEEEKLKLAHDEDLLRIEHRKKQIALYSEKKQAQEKRNVGLRSQLPTYEQERAQCVICCDNEVPMETSYFWTCGNLHQDERICAECQYNMWAQKTDSRCALCRGPAEGGFASWLKHSLKSDEDDATFASLLQLNEGQNEDDATFASLLQGFLQVLDTYLLKKWKTVIKEKTKRRALRPLGGTDNSDLPLLMWGPPLLTEGQREKLLTLADASKQMWRDYREQGGTSGSLFLKTLNDSLLMMNDWDELHRAEENGAGAAAPQHSAEQEGGGAVGGIVEETQEGATATSTGTNGEDSASTTDHADEAWEDGDSHDLLRTYYMLEFNRPDDYDDSSSFSNSRKGRQLDTITHRQTKIEDRLAKSKAGGRSLSTSQKVYLQFLKQLQKQLGFPPGSITSHGTFAMLMYGLCLRARPSTVSCGECEECTEGSAGAYHEKEFERMVRNVRQMKRRTESSTSSRTSTASPAPEGAHQAPWDEDAPRPKPICHGSYQAKCLLIGRERLRTCVHALDERKRFANSDDDVDDGVDGYRIKEFAPMEDVQSVFRVFAEKDYLPVFEVDEENYNAWWLEHFREKRAKGERPLSRPISLPRVTTERENRCCMLQLIQERQEREDHAWRIDTARPEDAPCSLPPTDCAPLLRASARKRKFMCLTDLRRVIEAEQDEAPSAPLLRASARKRRFMTMMDLRRIKEAEQDEPEKVVPAVPAWSNLGDNPDDHDPHHPHWRGGDSRYDDKAPKRPARGGVRIRRGV